MSARLVVVHWHNLAKGIPPMRAMVACGVVIETWTTRTSRTTCERCRAASVYRAAEVERRLTGLPCPECHGGPWGPDGCFLCNGAGVVTPCPTCDGTGNDTDPSYACPTCGGTGYGAM